MNKKTLLSLLTILILLIAIGVFFLLGGGKLLKPSNTGAAEEETETVYESATGIYINELVSDSRSSLVLADGSAPDWIELYNGGTGSRSLAGMGLTDDAAAGVKYALPNVTLGAGEYIVILMTGTEGTTEEGYYCAGFRLSSLGETISLTDASGNIAQTVELPALNKDISYGRTEGGAYKYFAATTPGAANSTLYSDTLEFSDISPVSDLIINEYQLNNKVTLRNEDGEYCEWAEIKNNGAEAVELSGYGLSDNIANIGKWHFPDVTLQPGECTVVFLSGKNRTGSELHASFGINADETRLILTGSNGGILDIAPLLHDADYASVGRSMSDIATWLYYPSPTPGGDNVTKGFVTLERNDEVYLPK